MIEDEWDALADVEQLRVWHPDMRRCVLGIGVSDSEVVTDLRA